MNVPDIPKKAFTWYLPVCGQVKTPLLIAELVSQSEEAHTIVAREPLREVEEAWYLAATPEGFDPPADQPEMGIVVGAMLTTVLLVKLFPLALETEPVFK